MGDDYYECNGKKKTRRAPEENWSRRIFLDAPDAAMHNTFSGSGVN